MFLLIIALITINVILSLLILKENIYDDFDTPFPFSYRILYDDSEMNMFGCVVCSILLEAITSVYHIPAFICWVIYKIFHVGRRK